MEKWWVRNLAQTVREECFCFPGEEFRISARPSFAGSEAPASVEITLIFLLRPTPRQRRRVGDINCDFIFSKTHSVPAQCSNVQWKIIKE